MDQVQCSPDWRDSVQPHRIILCHSPHLGIRRLVLSPRGPSSIQDMEEVGCRQFHLVLHR